MLLNCLRSFCIYCFLHLAQVNFLLVSCDKAFTYVVGKIWRNDTTTTRRKLKFTWLRCASGCDDNNFLMIPEMCRNWNELNIPHEFFVYKHWLYSLVLVRGFFPCICIKLHLPISKFVFYTFLSKNPNYSSYSQATKKKKNNLSTQQWLQSTPKNHTHKKCFYSFSLSISLSIAFSRSH